jgi:hypothetical protein
MNSAPQPWSAREKHQVGLVATAPAATVSLLALVGSIYVGSEAFLFAVFALPLAYGILFFSVLPALAVLKRFRRETFPYFVFTVSAATVVPAVLVLCAYRLVTDPTDQPPADLAAALLLATTVCAALVASGVWLLGFSAEHAA